MNKNVKFKAMVMALASAGLSSIPAYSFANPTGGQVVAGNATIHQETASKVGITQTTDKAIIDWQKYNIGVNEHVQYYQPSASSVTLNRVVGQDPSQIMGRLTANGQVFLVNPNGIYFGKNAQIDVAGLVASTHNIRNEDFMAGKYLFNIPGKPGASVINEGQIRIADTGIAAFVAPSVANRGVIAAKLGKIALASANGFTLDFHGDELLTFLVSDEVAKTAFDLEGNQLTSFVENSGKIQANGGYVLLTAKAAESAIHNVINQSGAIEATSVGKKNGEIILSGGEFGVVSNSGKLDASGKGAGETGGKVQVTGEKIGLLAGTNIDVSGDQGGGKAIIGGDYLGGHASDATIAELGIQRESKGVQTAAYTSMDKDAVIIADALTSGKGGKVVLWSDIHTIAHGVISSKGGYLSGDGGFVETSGKKSVDIRNISVDASSKTGKSGTWLIDPATLTIDAATASSIASALNSGTDSTISATDSVSIESDIIKSAGGNANFTVNSAWIYLLEGSNIKSTSNKLNVNFETTDRIWIGRGYVGGESEIISNGGNVTLHGPNFVGVNGTIDADTGIITVKAEKKDSAGVDRGIWIFGSTVLRASKINLLTEDTLRADAEVRFLTTVVNAQTQAQVDQLTAKMEKANAPKLGTDPNGANTLDPSNNQPNAYPSSSGTIRFLGEKINQLRELNGEELFLLLMYDNSIQPDRNNERWASIYENGVATEAQKDANRFYGLLDKKDFASLVNEITANALVYLIKQLSINGDQKKSMELLLNAVLKGKISASRDDDNWTNLYINNQATQDQVNIFKFTSELPKLVADSTLYQNYSQEFFDAYEKINQTVSLPGYPSNTTSKIEKIGEATINGVPLISVKTYDESGKPYYDSKQFQCVTLIKGYIGGLTNSAVASFNGKNGGEVYKEIESKLSGSNYKVDVIEKENGVFRVSPSVGAVISFPYKVKIDGKSVEVGHVAIVNKISTEIKKPEDGSEYTVVKIELFEQNTGKLRSFSMRESSSGTGWEYENGFAEPYGWADISLK